MEVALELVDRDPCLGDLHLDVLAPVVGIGGRRARGVGGQLHGGDLVQQLGGHHLAGQAALGQVGRDREPLDHQAVVVDGLPDGDAEHDDRGESHHPHHALNRDLEPVPPAPPAHVVELQAPLLVQILHLQLEHVRLSLQEAGGFGRKLLSGLQVAERQRHGGRIGLLNDFFGFFVGVDFSLWGLEELNHATEPAAGRQPTTSLSRSEAHRGAPTYPSPTPQGGTCRARRCNANKIRRGAVSREALPQGVLGRRRLIVSLDQPFDHRAHLHRAGVGGG